MPKNYGLEDLRQHLFETLEDLRNPTKPLDLERANAVVAVSREITATAKVEVEWMKVSGETGSGFIAEPAEGEGLRRRIDPGARQKRLKGA